MSDDLLRAVEELHGQAIIERNDAEGESVPDYAEAQGRVEALTDVLELIRVDDALELIRDGDDEPETCFCGDEATHEAQADGRPWVPVCEDDAETAFSRGHSVRTLDGEPAGAITDENGPTRCDGCGTATHDATVHDPPQYSHTFDYCQECEQYRLDADLRPGDHEQYKLREGDR